FHNTTMDTNYDQPQHDDADSLEKWKQVAPTSLTAAPRPTRMTPQPQSRQALTKEQQQLLERRRNWVFMTAEDYATTDPKTGKSLLGGDDDKDDNMTAMERYFHRQEQSANSSFTNNFNRLNADRVGAQTNYFDNATRSTDSGMFGQTPFKSNPNADVFQSITTGNSANVFGGSSV